MPNVPIREGEIFEGSFRVERLLGRGGMGEVWQATRLADGRPVALKVLLEKAARKPDLVARFEREARITERIQSPFVCELLDSGRATTGELFLVFELLEGESLADKLKREGELDSHEVFGLIDDVLQGLISAHATGVVHRDLKPGNIFVHERDGAARAVILDFGISKLLPRGRDTGEGSITTFDATLGSFAYMAPEQVRGAARADERADIYAVGAVVFRALTGRLPFDGQTASMLLTAKLGTDTPSLELVTGQRWPAALERFIARSLARKREDRFATASEALAAWREIADQHERAWSQAALVDDEE